MHSLTQQKLSIVQNQHTVLVLAQDGRELLSALESAKETAAVASPLNAKDGSGVRSQPFLGGWGYGSVGGPLARVCKALV